MKAKVMSKSIGKNTRSGGRGKITFSRAVSGKARTLKSFAKRPGCTPDRTRYKDCVKTTKSEFRAGLKEDKAAGRKFTPEKRKEMKSEHKYHLRQCKVYHLCVQQ